MGVDQVLVGPGLRRAHQLVRVQLAACQHDLALLAADQVAVDVHVPEGVVLVDLLLLAERVEQRAVVPQAQVLERRRVVREERPAQGLAPGEGLLRDSVQVERGPGRRDVVGDVGLLERALVGRHLQVLHDGGIDATHHHGEHDPTSRREEHEPERAEPDVGQHREGGQHRHPSQDQVGRLLGVQVGVGRRLDGALDPACRVRELRDIELVAGCDHEQQEGAQDGQVRADWGGEPQLPSQSSSRVSPQAEQQDRHQAGDPPALEEAPEGQAKDVEADVVAEVGIGDAKAAAVYPQQDRAPRRAPCCGADQRQHQRDGDQAKRDRAARVGKLERPDASDGDARRQPASHQDRCDRRQRERGVAGREQADLGPQPGGQHAGQPQCGEPLQVGEQVDQPTGQAEHHEQRDQQQTNQDPAAVSAPIAPVGARKRPTEWPGAAPRRPAPSTQRCRVAIAQVGAIVALPGDGTVSAARRAAFPRRQGPPLAPGVLLLLPALQILEKPIEPAGHARQS